MKKSMGTHEDFFCKESHPKIKPKAKAVGPKTKAKAKAMVKAKAKAKPKIKYVGKAKEEKAPQVDDSKHLVSWLKSKIEVEHEPDSDDIGHYKFTGTLSNLGSFCLVQIDEQGDEPTEEERFVFERIIQCWNALSGVRSSVVASLTLGQIAGMLENSHKIMGAVNRLHEMMDSEQFTAEDAKALLAEISYNLGYARGLVRTSMTAAPQEEEIQRRVVSTEI